MCLLGGLALTFFARGVSCHYAEWSGGVLRIGGFTTQLYPRPFGYYIYFVQNVAFTVREMLTRARGVNVAPHTQHFIYCII